MKRILIINHPGNAFSNPTLESFIQYALLNSVEVDIRCRSSIAQKPNIDGLNWRIYGKFTNLIKKYFLKEKSVKVLIGLTALCEALFVFKKKYDLIIGVDREGLIDAGLYSHFLKIPYVYFSFEILFFDEVGRNKKRLENKYSKNAELWLVQDKTRAKCLMAENNLKLNNCFICPIASSGLGKFTRHRLRDQLGIGQDKKVAIMIGSLSKWSMSDEIFKYMENWPEDWVLIVHERYGKARQKLSGKIDTKYLDTRIRFSDSGTASLDDMGTILAGIDAGIAFYKPQYTTPYDGKNIKNIGLSSGKIATYLRYGIPILTNEIGEYAYFIRNNKLGYVLENPFKIGAALGEINRSDYSERCKDFFLNNLDANIYIPLLFNKLVNGLQG